MFGEEGGGGGAAGVDDALVAGEMLSRMLQLGEQSIKGTNDSAGNGGVCSDTGSAAGPSEKCDRFLAAAAAATFVGGAIAEKELRNPP